MKQIIFFAGNSRYVFRNLRSTFYIEAVVGHHTVSLAKPQEPDRKPGYYVPFPHQEVLQSSKTHENGNGMKQVNYLYSFLRNFLQKHYIFKSSAIFCIKG